jgi:hypothetical protein
MIYFIWVIFVHIRQEEYTMEYIYEKILEYDLYESISDLLVFLNLSI